MSTLCYLYIEEFKALRGVELVFDHRYDYHLEDGLLKITDNKLLGDDFFGESIYSLTAIVGKNGCGKSTAMEALMRIVVPIAVGLLALAHDLYLGLDYLYGRFYDIHSISSSFQCW